MIQKLKIALRFMQSSKTLYLGLPHTGLARSWEFFHPHMPLWMIRWGCDTLLPKWSMSCWRDNPDVQGGLELSDLSSYSFPLRGHTQGPLCSNEYLRSVASCGGTLSLQWLACAIFPLMLLLERASGHS